MTKRVRLLFAGKRPCGSPTVALIPDRLDLDELARRVPGAVGYFDPESKKVVVRQGALDLAALIAQVAGSGRATY